MEISSRKKKEEIKKRTAAVTGGRQGSLSVNKMEELWASREKSLNPLPEVIGLLVSISHVAIKSLEPVRKAGRYEISIQAAKEGAT